MSFARAIAKHLATQLDALTFDADGTTGNVFVGTLPSTPDIAVAVVPQPGLPQPTSLPTDLPVIQVQIRGDVNDYFGAETLAAAVIGELTCLDGVWLDQDGADEVWLIGMTAAQSTPAHLGLDPNQRHEFYANFTARTHSPTTHRPAGV